MNTRSALTFSPGAAGPLLTGPDPAWQDAAVCAQSDPDAWFPEDPADDPEATMRAAQAKAACRGCPARADCLGFALGTGQKHGIWGGFSERQLRSLRLSGATAAQAIAADEQKQRERAAARAAAQRRRLDSEREKRQGKGLAA